jgi:hypothetical protein
MKQIAFGSYGRSSAAFGIRAVNASRRVVQDVDRHWKRVVVDRLNHLVGLPKNWNGYGATAVKFDTASFALKLLESAFDADAPPPQIVPGARGGLQIEWHLPRGSIELDVEAPYSVYGWAEIDGQESEATLTNDFTLPAEWLSLLTDDGIANAAAA